VARTRGRPIPSGAVSVRNAWLFALGLCFVGLIVLLLLNRLAIILGVASLCWCGLPVHEAHHFGAAGLAWAWTFNWGVSTRFCGPDGDIDISPTLSLLRAVLLDLATTPFMPIKTKTTSPDRRSIDGAAVRRQDSPVILALRRRLHP